MRAAPPNLFLKNAHRKWPFSHPKHEQNRPGKKLWLDIYVEKGFWAKKSAQLVIPVRSTFQNDLHPSIGGPHPVLYFTTQIKKEILHSYVLAPPPPCWDKIPASSENHHHHRHLHPDQDQKPNPTGSSCTTAAQVKSVQNAAWVHTRCKEISKIFELFPNIWKTSARVHTGCKEISKIFEIS